MPYDSVDELPEYVQKLDAKKKRQWMAVFNGAMEDGDSEATAFRKANGVVSGEKQYVDPWDYESRKVMKDEANYNPVGMSNEKGCANCRFFIPPGACSVVAGDIAPTGISDYWKAQPVYEPEPIPVTIVGTDEKDDSLSIVQKSLDFANSVLRRLGIGKRDDPTLVFTKQDDGRTRFFTYFTNNFQDKHREVFPLAAHKEYVEWADKTGLYPELWIWHTPGTKFGQVDWLDVNNGFLAASGLVDEGKEYIAEAAARAGAGMSHGFLHVKEADGTIPWYRSYEISVLPQERQSNAHNPGAFTVLTEEAMAFSDNKKEFFKKLGIKDDMITGFEKAADNAATALKEAGIAYKEAEPTPETTAGELVLGEIKAQNETLAEVGAAIKSLAERMERSEKSIDEHVDQRIAAAVASQPNGFRATQSDDNIISGAKSQELDDWFGKEVMGAFGAAQSAGGGN